MLLRATGSAKESLDCFVRAAQLADAASRQNPSDGHLQYETGSIYGWMARVLKDVGRHEEAASANAHAASIFENLVRANPGSQEYRDGLANTYGERGSLALLDGRLDAGLKDYLKNLEIREALAKELPNSPAAQRNLMVAYSRLGDVLGYPGQPNLGDHDAAVEYFRKCLTIANSIAAADPTDQIARYDVTMARLRLAKTILVTKAQGEAFEILKSGSADSDRLLAADPQNKRYLINVVMFCNMLGDQFRRIGDDQAAIIQYDRALTVADRLRASDPSQAGGWLGTTVSVLTSYAELAGRLHDRTRAASIEKRSTELAERARSFPYAPSKAQAPLLYAALGEMHEALGDEDNSRMWLEKSTESWQALQADGNLPGMYAKDSAHAAALLTHLKP